MTALEEHLLAPPFGLPDGGDGRLLGYLRDEDWASALVLLREVVTREGPRPRWLLLLAYARFQDAVEVMVDEVPEAAAEALRLIDQALELGAPLAAVAPLREAAEAALDEATREALRLEGLLSPTGTPEALAAEELEALAYSWWRGRPAEAAALFEALANRLGGAPAWLARTRAALCLADAGRHEAARPGLEAALALDWTAPGLRPARATLEAVETALLLEAEPADFTAGWALAEARGRAVDLPFPSVWPHQERLLARCLALGDGPRARALARLVEARPELSSQLQGLVRRALWAQD
jgi:hypothetical protein